jgi:glycerol uptake facilitator protein
MCKQCFAEALGTFILVFFGCGVVAVDVISGARIGLFQVAIVWGLAVNLAIYLVGSISGAHLNPAITVSMAIYRRIDFPARKIAPYIAAQLVGAMLAAMVLYAMFNSTLLKFEAAHDLARGSAGSELSAMMFGEYFPNPAIYGTTSEAFNQVPGEIAFMAELMGTALLALGVFALTDRKKFDGPGTGFRMFPYFIGLVLAICIIIFAPFSQAGFNPARDFGPRLVSYFAGWGPVAIPGPNGGFFWVYVVAPVLGAVAGGGLYRIITKLSPGEDPGEIGALASSPALPEEGNSRRSISA